MTTRTCRKIGLLYIILMLNPSMYLTPINASITSSRTMPIIQSVIQDNLVFIKDSGIFVEPTGFAYSYSTFIYENIHLVIPEYLDIDYYLPHCSEDEQHITAAEKKILIDNVMSALRTRIPEYQSPFITKNADKPKRELVTLALLTAAGLMSLGISVYNTIQVKSVAKQAERMIHEVNRIADSQARTTMALKEVVDSFNNLTTVIIPAIENQIKVLQNEVSCTAMRGQFFTELNRRLTQELFVTVTSGTNALYNGKITPDFLPPAEIQRKLMTRPDMVDSIYQSDPTLVYQLGKFMLMSIKHKPFAISGLLILPRLLKEYIGIVLSINKVPIITSHDAEPLILNSADLAVKEMSSRRLWTPNFDTCIKHTGTYYCPLHEIRARYSHCLTEMLFNQNMTSCRYTDASGYPLIKQTSAGILVSSLIQDYVSIRIDADGNRQSSKRSMTNTNSTNFLTISDGSEIMIAHDIYLLSPDTTEIVLQINNSIDIHDFPVDNNTVPSLSIIDPVDVFVPHYLTMGWSYTTGFITLVGMGLLAYVFIQLILIKRDVHNLSIYTQTLPYHALNHHNDL